MENEYRLSRQCLNNLCVYERDGICMLLEISVTSSGMCADMVFVNVEENYLAALKTQALTEFTDVLNNVHGGMY